MPTKNKVNHRSQQWYGCTPSLPDARDLMLSVPKRLVPFSGTIDIRNKSIPIFDQKELGSCTANAISRAFMYELAKQNAPMFTPSRLMLYWMARSMEGSIQFDSGSAIRDAVYMLQKKGICPETTWPYDIDKFTETPSHEAWTLAARHQLLRYYRVPQTLDALAWCLEIKCPIAYGFAVGESFESSEVALTGLVPVPGARENIVGGHAVMLVSISDDIRKLHSHGATLSLPRWAQDVKLWGAVENSWSEDWGDNGAFYLPLSDVLNPNRTFDLWSLRLVEEAPAAKRKSSTTPP